MPGLTGHLLLLQLFQCRFVFGNDILLCSQLYSFSIDDCFGSAADELLVRELAFDRSGECLGLLDLHFVPNASLGYDQACLVATLGLCICPFPNGRFLRIFDLLVRAFPELPVRVGLYFRGCRRRFARRPPPKTESCYAGLRPKGSLSLTQKNFSKKLLF